MLYLVTDQENKTWRNIQWDENVTHEETNTNYHFTVYDNLLVAAYMYPAYDGITQPRFWEAVGEGESQDQGGFRKKYAKLTTLKETTLVLPTTDQRMTYALVCALNLIVNPVFRTWAINYLRDVDRTKETAHAVLEALGGQMEGELPPGDDYFNCAYPLLAALTIGPIDEFAATTVHRAYFDSLDRPEPLNLPALAEIVGVMTPTEIAEFLA